MDGQQRIEAAIEQNRGMFVAIYIGLSKYDEQIRFLAMQGSLNVTNEHYFDVIANSKGLVPAIEKFYEMMDNNFDGWRGRKKEPNQKPCVGRLGWITTFPACNVEPAKYARKPLEKYLRFLSEKTIEQRIGYIHEIFELMNKIWSFEDEYFGEKFRPNERNINLTPWKNHVVLNAIVRFIALSHKRFGNCQETNARISNFFTRTIHKSHPADRIIEAAWKDAQEWASGKGDDWICDFIIKRFNLIFKDQKIAMPYSVSTRRDGAAKKHFPFIRKENARLPYNNNHMKYEN